MGEIGEIKYHAIGYDGLNRRRHTHTGYHELLLCHSDGGSMLMGDTLAPIEKNTLFIINADYVHCSMPDDSDSYERSVVMFGTNYLKMVLASLGVSNLPGGILSTHGGLQIRLGERLGNEINDDFCKIYECNKGESIYKRAIITNLILTVLFRLVSKDSGVEAEAPCRGNDVISKVLAFIGQNLTDDVSAERISEEIGISKSYLCRFFRQRTTMTLTQYVSEQRLALSCSMLTQTDRTVLEIALSCGFGSPSYYCRIFKKAYGMTPLEYRQAHSTKK